MTAYSSGENFVASEVIRPAAVLSEVAARQVLAGLSADDVRRGGSWWTRPGVWRRYSEPWPDAEGTGMDAAHLGTISCVYDSPLRYSVTLYRASITSTGLRLGWSIEAICDDALRHAGLTLAACPRATLAAPPRPWGALQRSVDPRDRGPVTGIESATG